MHDSPPPRHVGWAWPAWSSWPESRPPFPTGTSPSRVSWGPRWCGPGKWMTTSSTGKSEEVARDLTRRGQRVEVIPLGGSNALGARGYIDCGKELEAQVPDLRHAVVAVGSGGTMAGLVSALGPERVLGINVGATANAPERVRAILDALSAEGAVPPAYANAPLRLREDQVGTGYGVLTPEARRALIDAAQYEGRSEERR